MAEAPTGIVAETSIPTSTDTSSATATAPAPAETSQSSATNQNTVKDQTSVEPEQALAENPARQKEIIDIINADPIYRQILVDKTLGAQKTGGSVDIKKLEQEAMVEYVQQKMTEVTQKVEIKRDAKFSPEQEKIYREMFQKNFQEHPAGMHETVERATELAKAKADEAILREDKNVTEEQTVKSAEAIAELQNKYNETIEKMIKRLPKNDPVIELLKVLPNSPDLLALTKEEKESSLIRFILEILSAVGFSGVSEFTKTMISPIEQAQ